MKEIVVQVTSKSLTKKYTINLDDEFALSFDKEWLNLSDSGGFVDAGELLEAYIKKSYESYLQIKEIDKLMKNQGE